MCGQTPAQIYVPGKHFYSWIAPYYPTFGKIEEGSYITYKIRLAKGPRGLGANSKTIQSARARELCQLSPLRQPASPTHFPPLDPLPRAPSFLHPGSH